jgi:hypothetical protein
MLDQYDDARSGVERRQMPERTVNCANHEERMDKVDEDINQGKGWFKAAAGFASLAVMLVGFVGANINSKLSNIETMLTTDKSDIRLLNEKVTNLQQDVREVQERHRTQDERSWAGPTR